MQKVEKILHMFFRLVEKLQLPTIEESKSLEKIDFVSGSDIKELDIYLEKAICNDPNNDELCLYISSSIIK